MPARAGWQPARKQHGALRPTGLDVRKSDFEIRFLFLFKPLRFPAFPQHPSHSTPGSTSKKEQELIRKTEHEIKQLESQYPGITEQIWRFEQSDLPACPVCGSSDTASVQVGIIGRTIAIGSATTKVHLMGNVNDEGIYFCNDCRKQFGPTKRTGA